jgi:hypothetical protein
MMVTPPPTRLAWHKPAGVEGARIHWHDQRGVPVCGAGWFPGRKAESSLDNILNVCKRCTEWLARARASE